MGNETLPNRPLPNRPKTGFSAWQATMGHISIHYSMDAVLTIQAYPFDNDVAWSAEASWGQNHEEFRDAPSFSGALAELWREVAHHHVIFHTLETAVKQPANYSENEWLDAQTMQVLDRLIKTTLAVFGSDWRLVIFYHPVQHPDQRLVSRLLVTANNIQIGGKGASLLDALRELFRNAAREYSAYSKHVF